MNALIFLKAPIFLGAIFSIDIMWGLQPYVEEKLNPSIQRSNFSYKVVGNIIAEAEA